MWVVMWLVLVFQLSSVVLAVQTPALVGEYTCAGQNPDGTAYTYDLALDQPTSAFRLRWSEQGTLLYAGVGFWDDDRLVVAFTEGRTIGIVSYRFQDRTLVGRWVINGGAFGTERCERSVHGPVKIAQP